MDTLEAEWVEGHIDPTMRDVEKNSKDLFGAEFSLASEDVGGLSHFFGEGTGGLIGTTRQVEARNKSRGLDKFFDTSLSLLQAYDGMVSAAIARAGGETRAPSELELP